MKRGGAILVLLVLLAGCSGALQWNPEGGSGEPVPNSYVVQPGDTLYSISWRYGLDYHDVAAWNRLGSDYLIHPGDKLLLSAPVSALQSASHSVSREPGSMPSVGALHWVWPAGGQVVRLFHADSPLAKGIDISGAQGADVLAAAAGKVVYAGSGIVGYGKLIIIKNSDTFLSAYADNDQLLVKEGDAVQAGDRIATMGRGRDGRPLLHFEIRYDGKPVDPLGYLPKR